jgi:hypothetical protein
MRRIGTAREESVTPMRYLELQSIGDANHHHGRRRYSAGHYMTELPDAAIDAFITRGVTRPDDVDWTTVSGGGLQAYGGAIAEVSNEDSAFSHRDALVEFFCGQTWDDSAEDEQRIASARAFGAVLAPYASGVYVNVFEEGEDSLRRAYGEPKLARLATLKRRYDPENVFHLNQNIAPAP